MSSILQRRRRAAKSETNRVAPSSDEQEDFVTTTNISNEQPSTIEQTIVESKQEEESAVSDSELEELKEFVDFLDTSSFLQETSKIIKDYKKSDDYSPSDDDDIEVFQQLLKVLKEGLQHPGDYSSCSDPENIKMREDFERGFRVGYDASEQYTEMQESAKCSEQVVGYLTPFLFGGNTNFAFFLSLYIIIMGYKPFPYAIYRILILTICRFIYICFFATPVQVAVLRSLPGFIAWFCAFLNVLTGTRLGDLLSVLIDAVIFPIKQYAKVRFSMYINCWLLAHIPDYPYLEYLKALPINVILFFGIPLLSVVIVTMLYIREKRKQRKHVLFLVNFLSVFTNPEMHESDIKDILGANNEIKDVDKMREIVIDAYTLWKKIPKSEASTFVNMYFDKAVEEYNRTFVTNVK